VATLLPGKALVEAFADRQKNPHAEVVVMQRWGSLPEGGHIASVAAPGRVVLVADDEMVGRLR